MAAIAWVTLEKYLKPLHELSLDDTRNIKVCDKENQFLDFDGVKETCVREGMENLPKSPDMLFICNHEKEIWFVEFKSSSFKSLNRKKINLERKILNGLISFYEIFQKYYDFKKYYFVVYPKERSFEDQLLFDLSETERNVEFGLEKLKGKLLHDVFTDHCEAFRKHFLYRFPQQKPLPL